MTSPQPLPKKSALVTGASRGIGRAIAVKLASQGFDLALVGRDEAMLRGTKELCERTGAVAHVMATDLADLDSLPQMVQKAVQQLGGINVLVNNAGVGGSGKALEVDWERWERCMQTNVMSVMRLTHLVAPHVKAAPGGAIVTIGSIASRTTYGGGGAYAASKHAVLGFSGCVFEDLREFGVKVTTICPGFVDTEMLTGNLERSKLISPDDVADAVQYILASSPRVCPTEIVLRPQYSPYK